MSHATVEWVYVGVVISLLTWVGAESWNVERTIEHVPTNAETIKVIGQQWFWTFEHQDGTKEVGQLHVDQLPRQRGRCQHRVPVLVGQRRDREVGARAPGRQDQIDLVGAHELFVGAHGGLDLAAVVVADQLDLALHCCSFR